MSEAARRMGAMYVPMASGGVHASALTAPGPAGAGSPSGFDVTVRPVVSLAGAVVAARVGECELEGYVEDVSGRVTDAALAQQQRDFRGSRGTAGMVR